MKGKLVDITFDYLKKSDEFRSLEYHEYRKKWDEVPRTHEVTKFPMHLDIEINSTCNLHCKSCGFHSFTSLDRYRIDGGEYMSLSTYKRIIDEGAEKGLKAIKLNYRGEPLLHPHLVEMVRYAKEKGILDVMFNTNGMLLDANTSRELLKAGLDQVLFSIDDHREKVYNELRPGADFKVVLQNLYAFKIMRDMLKSKCIVRVSKVNHERYQDKNENYFELFKRIADEVGLQEWLDYTRELKDTRRSEYQCAYPWQRMVICASGEVQYCCGLYAPNKTIGNINLHDVEELWNSSRMKIIRKMHETKMTHQLASCIECPMRHKWINTNNNE